MISPRFVGVASNLALFEARGKSVVVNTKTLTASIVTEDSELVHKAWRKNNTITDPVWAEIASAALQKSATPSDITLAVSAKRTYTTPKRVADSATTAQETSSSLTPTSKYVASLLSSGEQVTIEDVLWISRFFDSNQQETTARPTWLAWGGEEGKRWSQSLSARLDYDSVVADAGAFETPGVQVFVEGDEEDRTFWAKIDKERGQFAHSLYMLTSSGNWLAWGNGDWFGCEEPSRTASFIELDDDAALFLASALFDAPEAPVDLRTPNPEAWDLAVSAYDDVDWTLIDYSMISAGNPVEDGYSPEERSKNASGQLRDANGRFANVGDTGAIKSSGIGGTITSADATSGVVAIQGDDGQTYEVQSSDFEVGAAPHPKADPSAVKDSPVPLDGILSPTPEPAPPRARISSSNPVLNPAEISDTLDEYSALINAQRQEKSKDFKKLVAGDDEPVTAAGEVSTTVGEDVPPPTPDPTPDNSDVEPVYLAIVDRDDPEAVTDLVALVPSSAVSSEPKTFRRSGGKWVEDAKILADIRSATPPPIIQLDADQYDDVLTQVDMGGIEPPSEPENAEQTVTAAGGADRNRGNAETLRRYWTVGPGGLKIRWGTGGDWTRCVRLLSKHLGPRAKGYCALRHHEMTGMWPGDKKNREMSSASMTAGGSPTYSTDSIKSTQAVLRAAANTATARVASMRVFGIDDMSPIPANECAITASRVGREFSIPLLVPEGLATGDGRTFAKGSLGIRTLPLPLMWQIKTSEGHDNSVLVGRIDRIERIKGGLGNAIGVFDVGPYGAEAQRLVEANMLRWVSVDLDKFEIDEKKSDVEKRKLFIKKGRAMGATLVPKPAFQECIIKLIPIDEGEMLMDSVPSVIMASASIASAIPVEPPSVWFERPVLNGPTPITVTNEGHIFGHIATWDTDHIGLPNSTRAPRSASSYAYFHTGVVRTAEEKDVRVGQLTLAGGHAPLNYNPEMAVKHYDDTASAIADVHAGEDSYGIYISGALRPGTTAEQIRALRASAPSGDWRAINRRLELVAICQVNVPGFPVTRSLAASGVPTSLVAAGTAALIALREEETVESLAASARARVDQALDITGYLEHRRSDLAETGFALSDGSFPIETSFDLRRAVQAYGHVEKAKQPKIRRHIVRCARVLDKADVAPATWKETSLSTQALDHREKYEAMVAAARAEKVASIRSRVFVPSQDELSARAEEFRKRIQK